MRLTNPRVCSIIYKLSDDKNLADTTAETVCEVSQRGVTQFGRVLGLGPRCRRFKSCHLDHEFDFRYQRVRLSLVMGVKPAFYDSVVQLVVRTPSIPRRRSGVQIPFESLKAEKKLLYLKRVCILFVGSHTIC